MLSNFLALYNQTKSNMFLFGEYHGTKEMPQIFINVLKEALTLDKKINVFLEIFSDMQGLLDDYLEDKVSYKKFLETKFYTEFYDGRQTKALFDIINFIKDNKEKMSCYFVDINEKERWDKNSNRDKIMSENIIKYYDKNSFNFFYAGNFHVISNKLLDDAEWKNYEEQQYFPCGFLLKEKIKDLVSINFNILNGKLLCLYGALESCKIQYIKFKTIKNDKIICNKFIKKENSMYDYEYNIKRVTPSYKLK